jgi:MFS family permease
MMETILEHAHRTTAHKAIAAGDAFTPPTASRAAVAALFLMNGAFFGTWVSRIPAVQAERGLSHGALGLALLAMALGALVAMPLAGRFSARFGSHRVSQICAVFYFLALPMLAVSPGVALFVGTLFCFGACHGGLDVAMNAQAVLVERRCGRPMMSSFHALFSVGGLAGAAIGGGAASCGISPRMHFAGAAVGLGVAAIAIAFPHLIDDREGTRRRANATLAGRVAALPGDLFVLGFVAFSAMVGEGAMADWSGIFLRQTLHSNEGLAAAGYATFSIAMAGMRFFGDRISARIGPVNLVRLGGGLAICGMSVALTGFSPIAAIFGFACVGAGFATVVPMVFSAAGRASLAPGMAVATVTTVGYLGFLIGPPMIGFAAELFGLRCALALVLVTSGFIVALAPAVRR